MGANKGIFQVLHERGKADMQGKQTKGVKERFEMSGKLNKILSPGLDAHAVLEKCTDFFSEWTALQSFVDIFSYKRMFTRRWLLTDELSTLGESEKF